MSNYYKTLYYSTSHCKSIVIHEMLKMIFTLRFFILFLRNVFNSFVILLRVALIKLKQSLSYPYFAIMWLVSVFWWDPLTSNSHIIWVIFHNKNNRVKYNSCYKIKAKLSLFPLPRLKWQGTYKCHRRKRQLNDKIKLVIY